MRAGSRMHAELEAETTIVVEVPVATWEDFWAVRLLTYVSLIVVCVCVSASLQSASRDSEAWNRHYNALAYLLDTNDGGSAAAQQTATAAATMWAISIHSFTSSTGHHGCCRCGC